MKLFYCTSCYDVVKLQYENVRSCRCGAVQGRYKAKNDIDTVLMAVRGPFLRLAILNTELQIATGRHFDSPHCWWPVACCVMPWTVEPLPENEQIGRKRRARKRRKK